MSFLTGSTELINDIIFIVGLIFLIFQVFVLCWHCLYPFQMVSVECFFWRFLYPLTNPHWNLIPLSPLSSCQQTLGDFRDFELCLYYSHHRFSFLIMVVWVLWACLINSWRLWCLFERLCMYYFHFLTQDFLSIFLLGSPFG